MKSYISACLKPIITSIREMIIHHFDANKASIDALELKAATLQSTLQKVQNENLNLQNQVTNLTAIVESFDRNLANQILRIQTNTTAIQHINKILSCFIHQYFPSTLTFFIVYLLMFVVCCSTFTRLIA